VLPAAADTCSADSDENCNGIKHEGCECVVGSSPKSCACNGTQTCNSSGKYNQCVTSCPAGQTCNSSTSQCGCPSGQTTCNGSCTNAAVSCGGGLQCATWNFDSSGAGWAQSITSMGSGSVALSLPSSPGGKAGKSLQLQPGNPAPFVVGAWISLCTAGPVTLRPGSKLIAKIYVQSSNLTSLPVFLARDGGESDDPAASAEIGVGSWTTVTLTFGETTQYVGIDINGATGNVYIDDVQLIPG